MKPFHIKLSDEHRAKLEALRQKLGLRSEAEVVRFFADHGADMLGASSVGIVGHGDSVRPFAPERIAAAEAMMEYLKTAPLAERTSAKGSAKVSVDLPLGRPTPKAGERLKAGKGAKK